MREERSGLERRRSTKSPGPGQPPLSRLEQHERMLAERERERREQQRLVSLGRAPSRGELRPRSVTETESDRDLPSYMRSTSASSKKEKLVGAGGPVERSRRRSITQHTQSQGDLRRISGDQDTSKYAETMEELEQLMARLEDVFQSFRYTRKPTTE